MRKVLFNKGDIIFSVGDIGATMYSIEAGKVGIYSAYGTAAQRLLTELLPGQYFGEMAIVEQLPRSATAVAVEDSLLLEVPSEYFNYFLTKAPEVAISIIRNLSSRTRSLTEQYNDACKVIAELGSMVQGDTRLSKRQDLLTKMQRHAKEYADLLEQSMDKDASPTGAQYSFHNGSFPIQP